MVIVLVVLWEAYITDRRATKWSAPPVVDLLDKACGDVDTVKAWTPATCHPHEEAGDDGSCNIV